MKKFIFLLILIASLGVVFLIFPSKARADNWCPGWGPGSPCPGPKPNCGACACEGWASDHNCSGCGYSYCKKDRAGCGGVKVCDPYGSCCWEKQWSCGCWGGPSDGDGDDGGANERVVGRVWKDGVAGSGYLITSADGKSAGWDSNEGGPYYKIGRWPSGNQVTITLKDPDAGYTCGSWSFDNKPNEAGGEASGTGCSATVTIGSGSYSPDWQNHLHFNLVLSNQPPEIISLSPTLVELCPGSTNTFKFKTVYKDLDGLGDIRYVQLIIDKSADWKDDGSPYPYFRGLYAPNDVAGWDESTAGKFYLYQSGNTRNWGWGGGAKSGYFQNGYIRFDIDQSSVSWSESQKQLTITWAVQFRSLFLKEIENTYLYVEDMKGAQDTIPETSPSNIEQVVSGATTFHFHRMGTVDTRCGTISGVTYQITTGTNCSNITGQPRLGGVTVKVDLIGDGFEQKNSDGSGYFEFVDIPAGRYLLSADKTGWIHVLTCDNGKDITITPEIIIPPDKTQIYFGLLETKDAWFQTEGGDAHAQDKIIDPIPKMATEPYSSLRGDGGYPGVVSYRNDYDFSAESGKGEDRVSPEGWLAQAFLSRKYYPYFDELIENPVELPCHPCDVGEIEALSSGFYKKTDSDLRIRNTDDGVVNLGGRKIVILVDGDLDLDAKIRLADNSGFVAFIVKENITINGSLTSGGDNPDFEGVYIADGVIGTGSSDGQFRGEGMFIAEGFVLGRDLKAKNNTTPAEKFVFRPDLWINTPSQLLVAPFVWQELVP